MAFSAPGKAFLAGGYLVLSPEYSAYTIALSSRMHSVTHTGNDAKITVASPQFASEWVYDAHVVPPAATSGTHKNPFVDAVLAVCGRYFQSLKGGSITIYSDDGFHSQTRSEPVEGFPRFKNHGRVITEVPKTGLGSSAALCVVVTAAVVRLQRPALRGDGFLQLVHNLAQIAHCHAQGKVGSGFDVATAVYGSIKYKRFSTSCVPDVDASSGELRKHADAKWDCSIVPCALPSAISMLMGDVVGGSETPAMVKTVLKWRQENPEAATQLWSDLDNANCALVRALEDRQQPVVLAQCIATVREYLRSLSTQSGVAVEPHAQTTRLDAAAETEGVIGGVVPGAGGDDAVCLLVEANKIDEIKAALSKDSRLAAVSWLNICPDSQGLLEENAEQYPVQSTSPNSLTPIHFN